MVCAFAASDDSSNTAIPTRNALFIAMTPSRELGAGHRFTPGAALFYAFRIFVPMLNLIFAACARDGLVCGAIGASSSGGLGAKQILPSALGQTDGVVIDIDVEDRVLRGIADDAERLTSLLHDLDLLLQHAPEHDDAYIAVTDVLQGAVGDRTLCLPGHRVLR